MEIEIIYRKYFHDVFLYIKALSGDENLAEEIAQETFLRAMEHIGQFDGRRDIRAWLFVIARNTYFRYCRRKRIYVDGELPDTAAAPGTDILDRIVEEETVRKITDSADSLPEPYREVFRLRIYGELSFEKIGGCFKRSDGWARVTFYRAKRMIQNQIGEEETGHGERENNL